MDDLPDLLARDFRLRPKGKSPPMAPTAGSSRVRSGSTSDDVFGGPPHFSQSRSPPSFGSLFPDSSKTSSLPVYDRIPGMKSSASAKYDDVFASVGSSDTSATPMADLLESSLGRSVPKTKLLAGFEELVPGFGGSSPPQRSNPPESNHQPTSVPSSKSTTSGLFIDHLEQISSLMRSGSTNINASPVSGGLFDNVDAFGGLQKSTPSFTSAKKENGKADTHLNTVRKVAHLDPFADLEPHTKPSSKIFENAVPEMQPTDGDQETNHTVFEKPSKSPHSFEDIGRSGSSSSEGNAKHCERNVTADLSHKLNQHLEAADDVWLSVSEIPLFTQLTSAPSPSRPPPPLNIKHTSTGKASQSASVGINSQGKHRSFDQSNQSYENSNSVPKQRVASPENFCNAKVQIKEASDATQRSSSASSSTIRKASSTTNILDDLTFIFGGPPSSGEFQEVDGESEERRRARFERHQRTLDSMAKALAEKNERDMQTRMEQEERQRIAESLDIEIKRWAAGKEGNLRALLSTLQYVLWPECGWQPASLTDLITSSSVKKVYRKATLCVHPDKVQQKGANLQQKYIAEKVFDILKIV